MKGLFLCLCLCYICPVSSCGVDPMRYVENYARKKGFDSSEPIISFMKLNTPTDYTKLMKEKDEYIACTRMVHTGYFKRAMETNVNRPLPVSYMGRANMLTKQDGGGRLGRLLTAKRAFDSGSFIDTEFGTQWLTSGLNVPYGSQASLARLQDPDQSFLQSIKQLGRDSASFGSSYYTPEFYNDVTKRR